MDGPVTAKSVMDALYCSGHDAARRVSLFRLQGNKGLSAFYLRHAIGYAELANLFSVLHPELATEQEESPS
jgi:hypothetical protein